MELRALFLPPMFLVRAGVPPLGPTSAEISGSSAEKATIPPAMARSAMSGSIKAANGSGRKAPPRLARGAFMASPPAPSSTPMWATAQVRALLLATGSLTTLIPLLARTTISSGSSAEKALIPLGQTATACSATCGDICLTPKSNGSIQKAACFDSVKACGSRVSLLSRSVRALRGSHNLSERATSWWPMLSVGVYPDRFGESVGGHSLCFLLARLASAEAAHPASSTVQPSISAFHCYSLNNLILACYHSAWLLSPISGQISHSRTHIPIPFPSL